MPKPPGSDRLERKIDGRRDRLRLVPTSDLPPLPLHIYQPDDPARPRPDPGIGRRLGLARELAGLRPIDVSIRTCASLHYLHLVETGQIGVKPDEVRIFAKLYRATADWILGRVPEQVDDPKANRQREPVRTRVRTLIAMRNSV